MSTSDLVTTQFIFCENKEKEICVGYNTARTERGIKRVRHEPQARASRYIPMTSITPFVEVFEPFFRTYYYFL